jgi:hypothetical protein
VTKGRLLACIEQELPCLGWVTLGRFHGKEQCLCLAGAAPSLLKAIEYVAVSAGRCGIAQLLIIIAQGRMARKSL